LQLDDRLSNDHGAMMECRGAGRLRRFSVKTECGQENSNPPATDDAEAG
jgi:hypothetical protein